MLFIDITLIMILPFNITITSVNNIITMLHGIKYISDLLVVKQNSRVLRSSNELLLVPPSTRLKPVGDRSFSATAPSLWNSIPAKVRHSQSVNTFKQNLKTYLFKMYYEN